ncbi:hypothetical protein DSM3645_22374 [Blastopirellula marina DSM 3645]|uniref:DUF4405 domain-containing protein n=1 Tax=Blastopirellula marina DSM 3645 TaxID=314230 RepID=A3ZUL8_9BACT|nr:hypothetical protein DSM3645_22374 [Blastopirellula marina DSM 3645]
MTLLTGLTFVIVAATGIAAFAAGFDIQVVGLHTLMGFVFILLVAFHLVNNRKPLLRYVRSKTLWGSLAVTAVMAIVVWRQPPAVKMLLSLSGNLGPAQERFQMSEDHMVFQYSPADDYKLALTVKTGPTYQLENPPQIAIWLENQGAYHIKTLLAPDKDKEGMLPYWAFKKKGWEQAKRKAEENNAKVDGVSSATPNGSFNPADYILPADPENSMPYKLLIEINQPGDAHGSLEDQPSLVYAVEIDNSLPRTFQVLDLAGYPQREQIDGQESWPLYYVNEEFGSALDLIDSALLTIERTPAGSVGTIQETGN